MRPIDKLREQIRAIYSPKRHSDDRGEQGKFYDLVYDTVILWFDAQKKVVVNQREEEEVSIKELQEQREYQKKLEQSEVYKLKKLLEWVKASQYTLQSSNKAVKSKQIVDDDIKKRQSGPHERRHHGGLL